VEKEKEDWHSKKTLEIILKSENILESFRTRESLKHTFSDRSFLS